MILPDTYLSHLILDRAISVDQADVQPASIDLRLSKFLLLPAHAKGDVVDPYGATPALPKYHSLVIPKEGFDLPPQMLVLGEAEGWLHLPDDVLAELHGKSTLGRLGLLVHVTAGVVDPGFTGTLTLELLNVGAVPFRLRAGQPIAQLVFAQMLCPAARPYGHAENHNHYMRQYGPTAAVIDVRSS